MRRPPPVEVSQSGYPVVGGPASGEYHALPYGRRDLVVAVSPPLTYVREAEVGPWASLDVRHEVYGVERFAWPWEGRWYTAGILVRREDIPLAEGALQALAGLWGGEQSPEERRRLAEERRLDVLRAEIASLRRQLDAARKDDFDLRRALVEFLRAGP